MKLRNKIAVTTLTIGIVAVMALALALRYTSPCEPPAALASDTVTMQAAIARCYGGPDIITIEQVARPTPKSNEVLVKVRAAAVNPLDWHYLRGTPYVIRMDAGLGKPADASMGVDFAGTVESVGSAVTRFKPGDDVFGGRGGAFAEYLVIAEDRGIALKPANMSFEQAASVAIAGITALQALRDKGKIQSGQKVLINGASGGVGTFAVQIAKSFGAEVTGVCSTRNLEMVRSIGADHVIDYKKEDYVEAGMQYDLIIDNVGNRTVSENRHVLKPDGTFVLVGGGKGDWIDPFLAPIGMLLMSPFIDQQLHLLLASTRHEELETLATLMREGKVSPVIDRRYSLSQVPDAIRYSESGRARGKIIINL